MRFLADECCPAPIIDALRQKSHDVRSIREVAPGTADRDIVEVATRQDSIIITEDYDFGELAVRDRLAMPGLVILSLAGIPEIERIVRVLSVVSSFGEALRNHITIVYLASERRRPLNSP